MASQINMTPKKPSNLGGLFSVLGSVAGAAVGSIVPGAGTLAGASIGSALGGSAGKLGGGLIDAAKNKNLGSGQGLSTGGNETAIQRRLQKSSDDPLQHISNAISLVSSLDPVVRKDVLQPLGEAYKKGYFQKQGWTSQESGPHF